MLLPYKYSETFVKLEATSSASSAPPPRSSSPLSTWPSAFWTRRAWRRPRVFRLFAVVHRERGAVAADALA